MKTSLITVLLLLCCYLSSEAAGPSGTLPVIYINIEDNKEVTSKDTYLNADYWLEPNGEEGVEAIGSQSSPLTMKIKGRGNYSFTGFDKKPYRLKLDKKQPLLGMESSKHFGLLAHADDSRGFLRNTLGFAVSEGLKLPWTPRQKPLEVVVNGTYRGLYFLVELIRIDKKRVNITPWEEEDTEGHALEKWIEGGSLVEIDNYLEDAQVKITDGDGAEMRITYDKSVDFGFEPDGYRQWLRDEFNLLNSLIFGDKNSTELWEHLDLDDCARFMLVQELTNNYESFHGSCYLFREKGENEKWHFSPVWDFGSAFFRDEYPNFHFWEYSVHHNHWAAQLWQFPVLRAKMKELWIEYYNNGFRDLSKYASEFIDKIEDAAILDKERWPQYGNENLHQKLSYVDKFLKDGAKYLNNTFDYTPPLIAEDFTVPEDEEGVYHVFFRPTGKALEWPKVKVFVWDSRFTPMNWPGVDCDYVKVGGKDYWHYRLSASEESDDYMLLFDNGMAGKGENQTYDLKVRKRGIYTLDMENHAEPSEYLEIGTGPSGVINVADREDYVKIIMVGSGVITLESADFRPIDIAIAEGRIMRFRLHPGENTISLPRGIYFVNGRKVKL